ncbi:glycyl-radical enzyme activating protein [Desulfobaculum bizertense]|uniref:glycyl-radical enzyme activating protein n=1 Tax=Desulfobaculum bizertense TaxID=376490 RepID=UPI001F3E7189|nr:glycyl-radical enzyme activating protein [Desulfobaculum bizertense]UIJ37042.1 glycyl-radical enzyme activating protein [Desulfobaculum bizertense]
MQKTTQRDLKGLIFDVQGHSVHDGPGTRTTVFLNGCPLHCLWCSNPEGLYKKPVMMHRESQCQCCGHCIQTCSKGSATVVDGKLHFDRNICDSCVEMECISTCYNEALTVNSEWYSVDDLMTIFQRDRQFWGSRGGVTFSGGEPLFQKKFILAVLKACKESFIHTCIETTSCLDTEHYLEATSYVDWAFTDIKHMDSVQHKALTGVGNELILHNIEMLARRPNWDGVILPRVPIIPGKNDSPENIEATAEFIRRIGLDVVNLLPFHRLGESKYRQLGLTYAMADQESPSDEHMQELKEIAESKGLYCFLGSETPF